MRRIRVQGKVGIFACAFMFRLLFLAAIVILASACGRSDEQVKVYRLVKAPLESAPDEQTAATNAVAGAAPQIKWQIPEGWMPGSPSSMRYASFLANGENGEKADISVVTFPGDGGSDLDNINRWRQQIGLAAIEESVLSSTVAPLKNSDLTFLTADLIGADSRTFAAWVRRSGRSWFFKLTGPKAVVEKEKPTFVKFLQSVRF